MAMNNEVLAVILGGGQARGCSLTQHRSAGRADRGSYRLIDIPVSNCLHADIRRTSC